MVSAVAGVLIVAAVIAIVFVLMPKEGRTASWVQSGAGGSTVAICLTGGFALGLALLLNGVLQ